MADTTDLDVREQVVRIDRMIEEGRKFAEESHKLAEESRKLSAEQSKLTAEAAKFSRERGLQTLLAITGLIGGLLTLVQFFFRAKGSL